MFNIKEFKSSFFWRCVVAELLSSLFYCFAASAVTLRLYETKYKDGVPSPRWKDPSELSMVSLTMGISVTAISFIFNVRYGGYILSTVAFGHFACWRNTLIEVVAYLLAHMLGGTIFCLCYLKKFKKFQFYEINFLSLMTTKLKLDEISI